MSKLQKLIPTVLTSGNLRYWQSVINRFGANLIGYWPLDEASGNVAQDISGNGRNGAHSNVTLGQAGIGDGKTAAGYNGTSSYTNVYSTSLRDAFNFNEMTLVLWPRIASDVWYGATGRALCAFGTDLNNRFSASIRADTKQLQIERKGGNVVSGVYNAPFYSIAPFQMAVTVSATNTRMRVFLNRSLMANSYGTFGSHVGAMAVNWAIFGANQFGTSGWFLGSLAHGFALNREATPDELRSILNATPWIKNMAVLGDSISDHSGATKMWNEYVADSLGYGVVNHAQGSQSIMPTHTEDMGVQTANAANDDADLIVIALGTNDNNAGNMAALQTEYATHVAALKVSNPRAKIVALSPPPLWTDATGTTESSKSNIRGAIAAAAASQNISYVDIYTLLLAAGYNAAEHTADGVHPNAAGHQLHASVIGPRL